jgi:outer membrane protein OmpA-like peptidoglycan-associated protein
MKKTVFIFTLLLCSSAVAGLRQYAAKIESSDWQLSKQSRLQCTLAHNIPGYGDATFTAMASKQLNMEFELDMLLLPKSYGVAAVYSVPPKWMPGRMQRAIGQMTIRKQYTGDLPEAIAWTMLYELEKGYWPTIYYQDWYDHNDKIAIGLNASNFATPYRDFAQCVSNLLPYSFDDIAYSVLTYKKNSVELTKHSKLRLGMIGDYLKEDIDMELVLLDGYSDSYGGRAKNEQLSVRRASEIKDFFQDMGLQSEQIDVTGHGERRHISGNDNEVSRGRNRRVVIRMTKP